MEGCHISQYHFVLMWIHQRRNISEETAYISPAQCPTIVPQCVWITSVNSSVVQVPELTQLGSWLYQTQLWPEERTRSYITTTKRPNINRVVRWSKIVRKIQRTPSWIILILNMILLEFDSSAHRENEALPRRIWPFPWARSTICWPPVNENWPWEGSVAS